MGSQLQWHISYLELLAMLLALRRFRPSIQGKHMLVQIDNRETVAYINHQGSIHSCHVTTRLPILLESAATEVPASH